jgi:hypothetical protein
MSDLGYEEFLSNALDNKAELRKKLRELSIEDKLKIIALMQRRANIIRRSSGRQPTFEWSWETVGLTQDSPPPSEDSLIARLGVYEYALVELNSSR